MCIYAPVGCGDEDIFTDGQDEDFRDSENLDTDSTVEYRVRECDPHSQTTAAAVTRCERTTSYHDPTRSSQHHTDTTRPLLERGTSYHDPTDDPADHKDMATGTTGSLLRGVCLEEYMDVVVHGHDGDDHVFRDTQDTAATGDQNKLNIQQERNKLFEQMQKYRRLKSENEHLPTKKKGLFNKIRRKISN